MKEAVFRVLLAGGNQPTRTLRSIRHGPEPRNGP